MGQIISRFDFLWARWMILSNVQTTWTWHNFTFGQLFMLIGANNDQIWLPVNWIFQWFWAMFETTWTWLISIFGYFSCALGQIGEFSSDSEQCSKLLDLISIFGYFSCALKWLPGLDEWFWAMLKPTWTLFNFSFGQLFMWIRVKNG